MVGRPDDPLGAPDFDADRAAKWRAVENRRRQQGPLGIALESAAGAERFAAGLTDPLDAPARARWPLDDSAGKVRGAGVKA